MTDLLTLESDTAGDLSQSSDKGFMVNIGPSGVVPRPAGAPRQTPTVHHAAVSDVGFADSVLKMFWPMEMVQSSEPRTVVSLCSGAEWSTQLRKDIDELTKPIRPSMSAEQWIAELRAWIATHPRLPYEADDSRESIYEGRGE